MNLDTSRILNTDEKVLANAFIELAKTGNTIEAARHYAELYKNQPLSFIIENSERIFAEPRRGLGFYQDMVLYFPLYTLCDELAKITNYVHDHKDAMHPMLAEDYGRAIDRIRTRVRDTNCFATIEDMMIKRDPSNRGKIMTLCTLLSKAGEDNQSADSNDDCSKYAENDRTAITAFNNMNKLVASVDPIISLVYLSVSPRRNILKYCARNIAKAAESGKFAKTMESAICVNMMSSSELFQEAVHEIPSMDAKCILEGLANADVIVEFSEYSESMFGDTDDYCPEVTLDNFVEAAVAELEETKLDADYDLAKKVIVMDDKLAIYESVLDIVNTIYERYEPDDVMPEFPIFTQIKESVGISGAVTVEDGLKIIVEATSVVEEELDVLLQEYTVDGRPGGIINRHSAGTKYNEDITRGIDRPKSAAPSKNGASSDDDDNDSETIPKSSRLDGSDGMPDDSDPNKKMPKKPKQGILGKVTNKAMDADAASKHKSSKLKAAGQATVNAGKAVLKVPGGVLKNLTNAVKSIETMDDNRRKEYMIRPGFRKKIFKNIRVAAMYGATWHVNKLYLPIAMFARKMSKEKNKRIRNDFASELETEIKVTEAKIEDANAKGDQEQRYQLIRIKDKLTKDLERVKYNSRYL